jgi:hypothetical protein
LRDEVKSNKDRISKLKKNAKYTQTCKEKKLRQLIENKEVVCYDKPEKPPLLFKHLDLHEHIHDCVEFGSADAKRRKKAIKVRTTENLRKNFEERYEIYMARTTLKSYLLPSQSNSIAAKAHHHPAWVAVFGVSHTDMREHPDSYYCLALVKCAKQFASTFANVSVVISQDDKAKIRLGVPAVGHTFHILQSINELTTRAPHGSGQVGSPCKPDLIFFFRSGRVG